MSQVIERCPMCGLHSDEKCDLMTVKDKKNEVVCCCENLKKASVKKQ